MIKVFQELFPEKIRFWNKSQIILLHILSLFTPVNKIYKINKNIKDCFNYFFDFKSKINPLKDDIYELQKNVSNTQGKKLKESLLTYYYNNDFLDLSITFIDGHVIAYFGKESFQKLKHSTRNKIIKSLEVFNFSDKRGRIFYFRADHDVEGMRKNIEKLLLEVQKIIGKDKIKILVFDRGGFSQELFKKLNDKFNLKFITLVVKSDRINEQIDTILQKNKFVLLANNSKKKFILTSLEIGQKKYRALLIRNELDGKIHPFITNMSVEELSNQEMIQYYSMHWRQEQEHNAFGKSGGNMHSKAMQETDFEDNTKINNSLKIKNRINKLNSELIQSEIELKRIKALNIALTSKIKPKSKKTDEQLLRKQLEDYENRQKTLIISILKSYTKIKKLKIKLDKMPINPRKKKYKHGPVDYSISITNLANNLNSRLVEIATNKKEKLQLSTLIGSLYNISAEVYEDKNNIYVKFINIRQQKQINMVKNLCDYFNPKNIKLREKTLNFAIKSEKNNGKIKNTVF